VYSTDGSAANLCAAASALLAADHVDEAEAAYRALIRYHPATATCAAKGLSDVAAKRKAAATKPRLFDHAWFTDRWHDATPWLPAAAVVVGLLCLVWTALFRRPSVRLGKIEGLPKDRETLGDELVATIRDSVERLHGSSGGLAIVGQWGDAVDIPGDVAVGSEAKVVVALLKLVQKLPLVRRLARQFEVAGQLLTDGVGTAATFALTNRTGRQASVATIAAATYDPPARGASAKVDPLAIGPAAAEWLVYELYARRPPGRRWLSAVARGLAHAGLRTYAVVGSPRIADRLLPLLLTASLAGARPLGSPSWESFALFAAGSRLHGARRAAARELYLKALAHDPESNVAVFNLAKLEVETGREPADGEKERRERARMVAAAHKRIREVKEGIEAQSRQRRPRVQIDALWYRAAYGSAALAMLGGEHRRACAMAAELVRVLESTLLVVGARRYRELRRFLLQIEPAVLALYAYSVIRVRRATPVRRFIPIPTRRDLSRRLRQIDHRAVAAYIDTCSISPATSANNLAAYYAFAARVEPDEWRRQVYRQRALAELRTALAYRRTTPATARTDATYGDLRSARRTRKEFSRVVRFAENPLY